MQTIHYYVKRVEVSGDFRLRGTSRPIYQRTNDPIDSRPV